jgi:hypothetical protein
MRQVNSLGAGEQCFVVVCQEERLLQFQKFLVNRSCPGMQVLSDRFWRVTIALTHRITQRILPPNTSN